MEKFYEAIDALHFKERWKTFAISFVLVFIMVCLQNLAISQQFTFLEDVNTNIEHIFKGGNN